MGCPTEAGGNPGDPEEATPAAGEPGQRWGACSLFQETAHPRTGGSWSKRDDVRLEIMVSLLHTTRGRMGENRQWCTVLANRPNSLTFEGGEAVAR